MASIIITTTPPPSPGPTMTHYQQLAAEFVEAIDKIMAILPQLEAEELVLAKLTRGQLGVSDQFCATTVSAVEQLPALQVNDILDPVEARDTLQFLEAFRTVKDKSMAFARTVKFAWDSQKARLVRKTLEVYAVSKGLGRAKGDPQFQAHVDAMARDLGRKGLRKPTVAQLTARANAAVKKAAEAAAAEREVLAA